MTDTYVVYAILGENESEVVEAKAAMLDFVRFALVWGATIDALYINNGVAECRVTIESWLAMDIRKEARDCGLAYWGGAN